MTVSACAATADSASIQAAPIERPMQALQPVSQAVAENRSDVSSQPAQGPQATSQARIHTVSRGENLYRIALNNGMTTQQLAALNDLAPPYTIVPGQALRLDSAQPAALERTVESAPDIALAEARPSAARPGTSPSPAQRASSTGRGAPQFVLPVDGRIVARSRNLPGGGSAPGWTFAVNSGARVSAAADGSVMYAGDGVPGFGNLVLIRHSGEWVTAYGHNDRILVNRGDRVEAGQAIARAPRVRWSQAPEIFFEVRNGVTPVDPGQVIALEDRATGERFAEASR